VFDVAGKRVRTLANATPFPEGRHCLLWDGRDDTGTRAASGVYFYRIEMGAERLTGRVVLLR
jgi:flagellar hook assembly protein FlgD